MRARIISLFLIGLSFLGAGQEKDQEGVSSLEKFRKDSIRIYRNTILRPYVRLENRRSFIEQDKVNFLGFLAGVVLYEHHIVCAGYYFLDWRSRGFIPLNTEATLQQKFTELTYHVFSYQYILVNNRYVQLNTPLEFGYGGYKAEFYDEFSSSRYRDLEGNFVPFGGGLQLIVKPLNWAGLSGSGGYRYVHHDAIRLSFNGWFYSFGAWVDARYLLRELLYRRALKKYQRSVSAAG